MAVEQNTKTVWLACMVILLSRIPFIFEGYGAEEDAWGLILTARNIDLTGVYEVSRMPGHPLQELLLSQMWDFPSWLINLFTAIVSTTGVFFFMITLRHWNIANYIPAGLVLAFTPIYFINSVNVMDYTWALSLVMVSMYLIATGKYVLAGVILGLACGFRITAGAMGIAFAVMLLGEHRFVLKITMLGVATVVTALVSFFPTYIVYGTEFFTYYEYFPYPPFFKNVYKATVGAWGVVGMLAVGASLILVGCRLWAVGRSSRSDEDVVVGSGSWQQQVAVSRGQVAVGRGQVEGFENVISENKMKWVLLMCTTVIVLYSYSFLKIPQKSAFVIPMIPFIILPMAMFLSKRWMYGLAACMIVSSFLFGINLDDPIRGSATSPLAIRTTIGNTPVAIDPLVGMVTADYLKRKQKITYAKNIVDEMSLVKERTIIIAGFWQNELKYFSLENPNPSVTYVYYENEQTLKTYQESGFNIFYLPEQDYYNDLRFKGEFTRGAAEKYFGIN